MKKMNKDITVIIPTYNEEDRIEKCILSCLPIAKRIIVMDNMSTDQTQSICEKYGVDFIKSDKTYKERITEAINYDSIDTTWVFYIDADEVLTKKAQQEFLKKCEKYKNKAGINGFVCKYRKVFMGKELVFSGTDEYKMRLFRKGTASFENNVELDEHLILNTGKSKMLKKPILHYSFRNINHLIIKLNGFAERKAKELLLIKNKEKDVSYEGLAPISKLRRKLKFNLYYKMPISLRSSLHFFFLFYLKLGFLDGKIGKMYLFYRVYWYGMLTDTYFLEMRDKK